MLKSFFPGPAFTAETLTGARAAPTFPIPQAGYSFLQPVWGYYDIAANVEDGDIFVLCKTPAKFLAMFGFFQADDIDTGTEVLDMDLGWAANGGGSETWTAPWGKTYTNAAGSGSATGLLDIGVMTGDAVSGVTTAACTWRPIPLGGGKFFSRETKIQVEANVAANAFTAGSVSVLLLGQILG